MSIDKIYSILESEFKKYPMPVVDLITIQTKDPYKILVATILSARTKDKTTKEAAERLFKQADSLVSLSKLSIEKIEELIYPVGFYKNKSEYLHELPKEIQMRFSGVIPSTIDNLVRLPGVGRKTANLVVSMAFNKPGICVDVHVHRICNRLGYVKTNKPYDTEMALRKKLPKKYWTYFNSYLVSFGQHLCRPVGPKCIECPIKEYCEKRLF
ncbi:MAG: endonuclease III [Candidatus Aenigmarchaeota archaeon]|nr:endonuclease III [Candidatus Aenigmarchaeota archaeon]